MVNSYNNLYCESPSCYPEDNAENVTFISIFTFSFEALLGRPSGLFSFPQCSEKRHHL